MTLRSKACDGQIGDLYAVEGKSEWNILEGEAVVKLRREKNRNSITFQQLEPMVRNMDTLSSPSSAMAMFYMYTRFEQLVRICQ